ncbi:MAG: DUF3795 domain-containing protein [Anaerolineaceae bacterium]|nr:DUF3795 domain-containing protein [Anaerolineaceae bacterium]
MKMPDTLSESLLAPCGITCITCYAYLRKKKPCLGCLGEDAAKPNHCRVCNKKTCATERGLTHCAQCDDFPCLLVKRLDKSYRQRYQTSLIENGKRLREVGFAQHLLNEQQRWQCSECGGVICIHDHLCSNCGVEMDLSLL